MSKRFEDRFPQETAMTEAEAQARKSQAEHALERLAVLRERGHENIVQRTPEQIAALRERHRAERRRREELAQ